MDRQTSVGEELACILAASRAHVLRVSAPVATRLALLSGIPASPLTDLLDERADLRSVLSATRTNREF